MLNVIIYVVIMIILGIESSCDETGVALYHTRDGLIKNVLNSQIFTHKKYGGVVPELASREHIKYIICLLNKTFDGNVKGHDLYAISYTRGPGLAGALLVGASIACAIGLSLNKPMLGIHHLEGHLLSPFIYDHSLRFPFVALLISGGHTQLIHAHEIGKYTLLGETVDDAVGEAFDKSAKLLGLGYPGGAAISSLASFGYPGIYRLPRPMLYSKNLNFSFSGLKTAVQLLIMQQKHKLCKQDKANIAMAFVDAIVEVLVFKSICALKYTKIKRLVVAGGVSANRQLRIKLNEIAQQRSYQVYYPELSLCTDNGAMIAFAAALKLQKEPNSAKYEYSFDIKPRWLLSEI